MVQNLAGRRCAPCEGGVAPLTSAEYAPYLEMVSEWTVSERSRIERSFVFRDFAQALRFLNMVGAIAEKEGHHPDMLLHSWNKVSITLWTHAIGGLSINDFIVAAKIDRIEPV